MNSYQYPEKSNWKPLLKRPELEKANLSKTVAEIFEKVQNDGDEALFYYNQKFDGAETDVLEVSFSEIEKAEKQVSEPLKAALQTAKKNIEIFHLSQQEAKKVVETTKGIECWRESRGIEKVGLYIPGGTAPLFSTVLMLAIPAKIAGCKDLILCTPPDKNGQINPVILYAANLCGVNKIFKVGGAQAIAALTFGTESIPSVYKIFGPGNQYVTEAKSVASQLGLAIDLPAGPSEVLVIADATANPEFCAADLLSQAEHGADSQVVFLCTNPEIFEKTKAQVDEQLQKLPRKSIAEKAIENSNFILLETIEEALDFSNLYAPEHLILALDFPENYIDKITNAGSVFLGHYSCESAGDYASGTNHTLPTNGFAKNYSGVSLDSFVKKISFQKISKTGIENLGKAIEIMAEAEGLFAHKNAVTIRLNTL